MNIPYNDHDTICTASLTIRVPQKLKDEIKRQADELEMSISSLLKVVLAQQFIKH